MGAISSETTWEETGVGEGKAVSPDDMIQWDRCNIDATGVNQGGTYGFNEPAVYLPGTFRHKYVLNRKSGDGAMTVVVKDDNGHPINGVTIILDTEVRGTTSRDSSGVDGTLHIPNVPAGSHFVEAQQYTGPALTPVNLNPTPEQILALPDCPANPMCKAVTCPQRWTLATLPALLHPAICAQVPITDGSVPGFTCMHGCYPPVEPQPGCDLLSDKRPWTVVANQDDTVTLTLCVGAACTNGVQATCQHNCTQDSDCPDNNQICQNRKCAAPPRIVHITAPFIQGVVNGPGGATCSPNASVSLDVTCDTTAQANLTDWLCDNSHLQFCQTPITGGKVDKSLFMNGNGDCNLLQFHFVCTMDPNGAGGVIVGADMRLLDGCNPGEDEADALQWKVTLPPVNAQNPSAPDPAVTWGGASSCWYNGIAAHSNDCCYNAAALRGAPTGWGTAANNVLTFTSLRHP